MKLNHPNLIRAIIVEDEKVSSDYLLTMLAKNHPYIEVVAVANTVTLAVNAIKEQQPDIVFLDIQIQKGTGFDVLDQLGESLSFEVIFTTGYVDFKEKALDYFAFYYLNKPIQAEELERVLKMYELKRSAFDRRKYEAFKYQIENKGQSITIFEKGEYTSLRLANILYCEASGSYTLVHLKSNQEVVLLALQLKNKIKN